MESENAEIAQAVDSARYLGARPLASLSFPHAGADGGPPQDPAKPPASDSSFSRHARWRVPFPAISPTDSATNDSLGRTVRSCTILQSTGSRPLVSPWEHERLKTTKGRHNLANLMPGAKAPNFQLPRDGGGILALDDFKGKKLVLYFYPKADTPGCTTEAKAFSALHDAFARTNTAVVGVSADTVKAQDAFKGKHKLTTPLASDESHRMLEAYGVWGEKSMYGRTYMGITRTTFLIGPDGHILRVWPKVKVNGHAEEVLAAATAA
jgi:thioredoxin-dependent peroxiredoxin